MEQSSPRRRVRRRVAVAGALVAAITAVPLVAQAALPRVSTALDATGFPTFYQDAVGTNLKICNAGAICGAPTPEERFYFRGTAIAPTISGKRGAVLVLALEAAYAGAGNVVKGKEITFGRIELRSMNGLKPNATYKVTEPYGSFKVKADAGGSTPRFRRQIGCARAGCNFAKALGSKVNGGYLRWARPPARKGFIGSGASARRVVGSPLGTDYFRIQGPNIGGRGDNTVTQRKFSIVGQINRPDTVRPVAPSRPDMTRRTDSGPNRANNVTTVHRPVFTGRAEDASKVRLKIDGKLARAGVVAKAAGYRLKSRFLALGLHKIRAVARDARGNVSPASKILRIRIVK